MKVQSFPDTFNDVNGFQSAGFGSSPDGLGMTVRSFGDDAPQAAAVDMYSSGPRKALAVAWALSSLAGTAIGAYHGYKRNDSVGWAVVWAFLGGLAPIVVIPVAYAQGIGERKGR